MEAAKRLDATFLQETLAAQTTAEVRFDAISQALYSSDASVYQILPLGVVIPKTPDDVVRTVLFILDSDYLTGETIIVDGGRHVRA